MMIALTQGLVLVMAACGSPVLEGRIEVLETLPHDSTAFTQGLVFDNGYLYESTGLYGASTIRRVHPQTGAVLMIDSLDQRYFGEGLALIDGRLVQLTYEEHVAFVYDIETLAPSDTLEVETSGWGLCSDGQVAYLTDGGPILFKRDASSWESLGQLQIVRGGVPLWEVNELECVGGHIYANVFETERIVKIDMETGRVVAEFDASALVPAHLRGSSEGAVLNGIAYDQSTDTFYLTGKLWPVMYRVRLDVEQ